MRVLDLLMAIREGGFRADDDPRKVRSAFCMNRQFKRDGRLWGLTEEK